jgi:hypothetical protein
VATPRSQIAADLDAPHRSGFQLDATVCVQVGEAIVYQIGRP